MMAVAAALVDVGTVLEDCDVETRVEVVELLLEVVVCEDEVVELKKLEEEELKEVELEEVEHEEVVLEVTLEEVGLGDVVLEVDDAGMELLLLWEVVTEEALVEETLVEEGVFETVVLLCTELDEAETAAAWH